jgi:hypothetical protein
MKKTILSLYSLAALFICTLQLNAQFGAMPPFTISVQSIANATLSGFHSGAFAQRGNKWLYIGGRTNGLHGLNSNAGFPEEYKNDMITVIDTTSWTSYTADLNQLPQNIADPLRSTNMQSIQQGDYLYMIGGYGWDSVASGFFTFHTLSAIHIDNIINAVINNQSIVPHIRQLVNNNFAISGGELQKLGNDYYLLFGHDFGGRYSSPETPLFVQEYSCAIKKFNIVDDGNNLSASNFSTQIDSINFHRRDLNTAPLVFADGSFGVGAYGGVFKPTADLPYLEPIILGNNGVANVTTYQQQMNQYTTAVMPIYDSLTEKMYTAFLGGIGINNYNEQNNTLQYDTLVPFVNDISVLTLSNNGTMEERVMPQGLPGLLGSNSTLVLNENVAHYYNGVIQFRHLNAGPNLVAYMIGGIRASAGNAGLSIANDSIYRIYITPDFSVSVNDIAQSIGQCQLFPNPASNQTSLYFDLRKNANVELKVVDVMGKEVANETSYFSTAKNNRFVLNTSDWKSGIYFCTLKTNDCVKNLKLVH